MKFILLGTQRSGSHLMRRYIRSHSNLECLTAWNWINPKPSSVFDVYKNMKFNTGVTILGYELGVENYPLVILLRKNKFEQALSHCLMNKGKKTQRHYVDGNKKELNEVSINVDRFKEVYTQVKKQTENILDKTKDTNRILFWYEDIIPYNQTGWTAWMPNKESAKLCKFLNVDWCRLSAKSKKIGQYDKIINYKELYESCNITE